MCRALTRLGEPPPLVLPSAAPEELLLPPDGSVLLAFGSQLRSRHVQPQLPGLSLAADPKKLP